MRTIVSHWVKPCFIDTRHFRWYFVDCIKDENMDKTQEVLNFQNISLFYQYHSSFPLLPHAYQRCSQNLYNAHVWLQNCIYNRHIYRHARNYTTGILGLGLWTWAEPAKINCLPSIMTIFLNLKPPPHTCPQNTSLAQYSWAICLPDFLDLDPPSNDSVSEKRLWISWFSVLTTSVMWTLLKSRNYDYLWTALIDK